MAQQAHTKNPSQLQAPSLRQQGIGQQNSQRRLASEHYSASEQQHDKAKLDLAANNAPRRSQADRDANNPQEVPQQDDRPERYPTEDAQVHDAAANRRS